MVGVDYSEPMLRKAHERVAAHQLGHVDALAVMDAQHLGFPGAFFHAVVPQYVITTVPDPEAALDEFARVTKPGGEIILVNHLGAEYWPRRLFDQGVTPMALRLGRHSLCTGQGGLAPRNGLRPAVTSRCRGSSRDSSRTKLPLGKLPGVT